jgi:hypothetical protein
MNPKSYQEDFVKQPWEGKKPIISWDVLLLSLSPNVTCPSEIPDDLVSNLGARAEIVSILKTTYPQMDLTDPGWGILEGNDFGIEFNIGEDDPISSIMLHVRGGKSAIDAIQRVCQNTGWRALDMTTGEFMDFSTNSSARKRQWRGYMGSTAVSIEMEDDVDANGSSAEPSQPAPAKKWWQFWK